MAMKVFEVTFSVSGVVQVQAEDEADAIRRVKELGHDLLLKRIDPDTVVVQAASEVDVGGLG